MALYDLIELKRACLSKNCDLLIDEVNFNISLIGPRKERANIINWLKGRVKVIGKITQLDLFGRQ
jgi:hypothetical protein